MMNTVHCHALPACQFCALIELIWMEEGDQENRLERKGSRGW